MWEPWHPVPTSAPGRCSAIWLTRRAPPLADSPTHPPAGGQRRSRRCRLQWRCQQPPAGGQPPAGTVTAAACGKATNSVTMYWAVSTQRRDQYIMSRHNVGHNVETQCRTQCRDRPMHCNTVRGFPGGCSDSASRRLPSRRRLLAPPLQPTPPRSALPHRWRLLVRI